MQGVDHQPLLLLENAMLNPGRSYRSRGFTLVEIAIVLVIIGLLLGGVLKGQELINSAKAKAVVNDFRNTMTMIAAYQDRFRQWPGDDSAADTRLPNNTARLKGNGNGQIEGSWRDAGNGGSSSEARAVWLHLRLANLATGSTDTSSTDYAPRNSEGGIIGVQSHSSAFANLNGRLVICQDGISGRIALQVDSSMDDGNPDAGSVQFGTWSDNGALVPATLGTNGTFSDSQAYVICTAT
ncbi:prepilin-type N-terminal cleavage/methylation domain-containing protein [Candidatus Dactylopiibacterium carminicum]|nr:prepilin-type N-terminal cleavage/methylation domain-containing protein [Candidatus Dactylopiibacterium carminicum]